MFQHLIQVILHLISQEVARTHIIRVCKFVKPHHVMHPQFILLHKHYLGKLVCKFYKIVPKHGITGGGN